MDDLLRFDQSLFHFINGRWHHPILDKVMPFIRASQFWVPLYLFLLVFILLNFKEKSFWWILFAALTAMLADFVSSDLIKEHITRIRPCRDSDLVPAARFLVSYCPKSSSFTSSHATNHFALATFFFTTLKPWIGNKAWLFYCWAGIIIYAQVYVGVHYPLDVISGGILGTFIGGLTSLAFNKQYKLA